jgi:hypothetical protein
LVGFGLAAFRPNISLVERGLDALVGCMVLFYAVRAERLDGPSEALDLQTETPTPRASHHPGVGTDGQATEDT